MQHSSAKMQGKQHALLWKLAWTSTTNFQIVISCNFPFIHQSWTSNNTTTKCQDSSSVELSPLWALVVSFPKCWSDASGLDSTESAINLLRFEITRFPMPKAEIWVSYKYCFASSTMTKLKSSIFANESKSLMNLRSCTGRSHFWVGNGKTLKRPIKD